MNKKRLELALNPLVALLEAFIVCGKNATYSAYLIAARIIETAVQGHSFEALYELTSRLSPDRVLEKAHAFSEDAVASLIQRGTKTLQLPRKVIAAFDFHDREFYGAEHREAIGAKEGKYVQRFLELSLVKPVRFVSALMVDQFTNDKVKLMSVLLDGFKRLYPKTTVELLLVDRGFFAKAVVQLLRERKQAFIMPAVKNKRVKKLIEQFVAGEIGARVEYRFGTAEVYLLFLQMEGEVLTYITNTKHRALKAHVLYKKRWQIETNFREQNQFLFRTTTRNFVVRYLAFAIAGLLFNAWQLQRTRGNVVRGYVFREALEEALGFCWLPFINREKG